MNRALKNTERAWIEYKQAQAGKQIGAGGIIMGADRILTDKDLKSAGAHTEAGAHGIKISYKI
jgi:hypothetical protein